MLIDTHSHLYWDSFKDDIDKVIQRSIDAGVNTIINVGVDVELSKKALEQVTKEFANIPNFKIFSTIGIHPHEAVKYTDAISLKKDIKQLEEIYRGELASGRIIAVGECGLDYVGAGEKQKELQKQLFQAQIDMAKKLNLPLIVHCRDDRSQNPDNSEAWDEVIDMTKNHLGIFHCYSGLEKITKRIIKDSSFLVSFAATITYPKNEYLREAAKLLPLERIVLETDCPFLPPQSKRGQRNEPANIKEIAQLIADIKGVSLEEITSQTTENAGAIFRFFP